MKYLKYFENMNDVSSVKEDIKDICLELEDIGFDIYVERGLDWLDNENFIPYIIKIYKKLDEEEEYFNYSDVEEVIERLKDYLGDKFICIDYPGIADGGDTLSKPLNFLEIYFKA